MRSERVKSGKFSLRGVGENRFDAGQAAQIVEKKENVIA